VCCESVKAFRFFVPLFSPFFPFNLKNVPTKKLMMLGAIEHENEERDKKTKKKKKTKEK